MATCVTHWSRLVRNASLLWVEFKRDTDDSHRQYDLKWDCSDVSNTLACWRVTFRLKKRLGLVLGLHWRSSSGIQQCRRFSNGGHLEES